MSGKHKVVLNLVSIAGDPGTSNNGDLWYNSSTGKVRCKANGMIMDINVGPPRVGGTTSTTTPTPNIDAQDIYSLTALAVGATFGAPTGTPSNGQKLIIRIKDNGTARSLSWNAAYVAGGISLPSTTVANKILHLGFIYNTDNSLNKWMLIASAQEA
jgi:hypothetical protein